MISILRQQFVEKEPVARDITAAVIGAIEAATIKELDVLIDVLDGYKTNAPQPQKRRILALDENSIGEVSDPKLPKRVAEMIQKRRRALTAPVQAASSIGIQELAIAFKVSEEEMARARKIADGRHVLIDIGRMVTQKSGDYVGQQLREILKRHPELLTKCEKVPCGQGSHLWVGNTLAVVELIMLLPGNRAGVIRSRASELFVKYHGGDMRMVAEIIENRKLQDQMRTEAPQHPARVFGEAVEADAGGTSEQQLQMERQLRANEDRRLTSYNPAVFTAEHNNFKDVCNRMLVDGIYAQLGGAAGVAASGYVVVLDDFNSEVPPRPRTCSLLLKAGIPADRILAPNKEAIVVSALQDLGVQSVKKHVARALAEDYTGLNVCAAYLDSTSGDVFELENMIRRVSDCNISGNLLIAYTLVERNFTAGGAPSFTSRILRLIEFMEGWSFKPLLGTLTLSYREFPGNGQRIGTSFWLRTRDW
jgi:hypothetical protein